MSREFDLEDIGRIDTSMYAYYVSPEKEKALLQPVKNLVSVIRNQLIAHQIDRDSDRTDLPQEEHRFDAFFEISDGKAAMRISSVGLPSEVASGGLFMEIYTVTHKQLIDIHTAKDPNSVGHEELKRFTNYTSDRLESLVKIVRDAKVSDNATFEHYL